MLLDTNAWIWVLFGNERAIPIKDNYFGAFLSAMSVWEASMLVKKSRLQINTPLEAVIDDWLEPILLLPLEPEISLLSNNLPRTEHKDPVDRIILATALIYDQELVTGDAAMIQYCHQEKIKALPL